MIELLTNGMVDIIGEASTFLDITVVNFSMMVFYIERFIVEVSGITGLNLQKMRIVLYGFGITLLTVKGLMKLLDQYILWTDGDPENPPAEMLVKTAKAIAISACFPMLYKWLIDITTALTTLLLGAINLLPANGFPSLAEIITGSFLMSAIKIPFLSALLTLAYVVLFFVLIFQFLKKGIEMLVLRLGVPLGVIGFIESDGGLSKNYFKIFFQCALAVMVQLVLFKLSVGLWMTCKNPMTAIIAVIVMFAAIGAPKFLAQFMPPSSGGGSAVSNLYFASSMASRAASLFKK